MPTAVSRQRVEHVVPAGDAQLEHAELVDNTINPAVNHGAPRPERLELHAASGDVGGGVEAVGDDPPGQPRQQLAHRLIVGAGDHGAVERHLVREVRERLLQVLPGSVAFHVLVIDVRNDGDHRRELQERPVTLIRFRHHVIALPQPGVAAERAQPPADHRRRIEPGSIQRQRHHRCRGGLPMRPGDRDPVAEPHQLGQHLGPRDHRHVPPPRLQHLGVLRPDRRRHHHHVRVADERGVVTHRDRHAERFQPRRHVRAPGVRAADLVPEVGEQLGDPAHADAADADEMHPPCPA